MHTHMPAAAVSVTATATSPDPAWPDIARPDVGAVLLSTWTVDTPEQQQATLDAFTDAWRHAAWPDGLLTITLFVSVDGSTVLNYAQWTDEAAYDAALPSVLRLRAAEIDRRVPGIVRAPALRLRLYRGAAREDAPPPGCLVLVSVLFDDADADRQRRWVDLVFEAMAGESNPPAGGLSGHFHLSTDGTRVVNYATWTSADAHQEAIARSGRNAVGHGPRWTAVQQFPGLASSSVTRYRLARSLARTTEGA